MAAKKTAKKAVTKSAAPAKKAVKKVAKKAAPVAKKKAVAKSAPTPEAIAEAAYLIYRRRVDLGLPGDSYSDWLEAEISLS